jgi:ATP-binding cassette, subfamily B, bacterial
MSDSGRTPASGDRTTSSAKPSRKAEAPNPIARDPEDLTPDELEALAPFIGSDTIRAVVNSDLLFSGEYGENRLVLTDRRIVVIEEERLVREAALGEVLAAYCKDFVGNGVLEVRLRDNRQIELVRYSKTLADAFQEIANRVNKAVAVNDDDLTAHSEEAAKTTGPTDNEATYRCPNCGHPLQHASDACPKCTHASQVMLRLAKLVGHHWRLALGGILLSVFFTLMALAPGLLVRELIDGCLRPPESTGEQAAGLLETPDAPAVQADSESFAQRRSTLYVIVIGFLCVITGQALTSHYRIRVMGTLGSRVITDLRGILYRTLQRLSLSYYDREHTGRIMTRLLTDTGAVRTFIVQAVEQMVIHLLTVVGIAVVLFLINWKLAAIALLPIPAVAICSRFFSKRFRRIFRGLRRKFATLSASVNETISGMRVVKSFGQEEREISGFNEKNLNVYNAQIQAVHARAKFGPAIGFMVSVGVIAVWLVGGLQVLEGQKQATDSGLTLGTLVLFITYMNQFYNPVRQLMEMTESFQQSATAAERIFNIMDMPSEVADHDRAVAPSTLEGRVEFENVSFGYNDGERVLKDIYLSVEPGQMIGLVGQTGSGKSTLVSLLCRFYDPTQGQIRIDGHDIKDLKSQWLRQNIGMVLQDSFLFAGTIRENIAYGRPDASEAEIIESAMAANAHRFIMNLPDGYDTHVGERGVMLSGGEKQRISIARAILKNPGILILDEATSAVDTVTESLIQEAMDRLVKNRTTFAIAHRLSTLRNADRLIVLENGEIIEQGTHEDLMARDGTYATLCRTQAKFAEGITPEPIEGL